MISRTISAVAAGILIATTIAGAAEPKADVVVTANRQQRESRTIPANVTIITSEDIAASGHNNLVGVLRGTEGVYIRTTSGNAAQAEIGMRGFGENSHGRVLVLLDGRKLNRPDMASINWLQIPVSTVARIEIERGANTVLYGDHAVAGVINIITKNGTKDTDASVSAEIGSFGGESIGATLTGSRNKLGYAVNSGYQHSDGYRDRSGYASWGVGSSINYDITDSVSSDLMLSINRLNYQTPGWLTLAEIAQNPEQSTHPGDKAENEYFNADWGLDARLGDGLGRASVNVAYGKKDIASDMMSWASFADMTIETISVMPKYAVDIDLLGHQNRILIGSDYYIDSLSLKRFSDADRGTQSSSAEIEKATLGVYAQDEVTVLENLTMAAGVRRESADVSASMPGLFDDTETHRETVADISAVWNVNEGTKLFARFGTVYRYPFVDEQVSYFGYGSDQLFTNLAAETGDNLELGVEAALLDKATVGLTVFRVNMDNEIAYNSATWQNENMDKTRRQGAELTVACDAHEMLEIGANYTFSEAKFANGNNDGKDVPLVPGHAATLSATVSLPHAVTVRAQMRYTGETFLGGDYGNEAQKVDDYTVTDLMVRYVPTFAEGFEAYVAVNNIFDEKYETLGYWNKYTSETGYYPAERRAIRIGALYHF